MDECKNCANMDNEYCFACNDGNQFKPMTNGDNFRAMTDDELAEWLACNCDCASTCMAANPYCTRSEKDCAQAWKLWLGKECE